MSLVADLHRRFATLIAELTKFGLIGTLGLIIDLGGAALLHGKAGFGPLVAKAISASVAAVVSYTGHRLWTFRHRACQSLLRGGLIFFGLNLIGLVISLLVIGFVTDALGQQKKQRQREHRPGQANDTEQRQRTVEREIFIGDLQRSRQHQSGTSTICEERLIIHAKPKPADQ